MLNNLVDSKVFVIQKIQSLILYLAWFLRNRKQLGIWY